MYEAISHVGGIAPLVVEVKSFEEENLKKDGIYREKMLKKFIKRLL